MENRSSRAYVERGCKANMFMTIYSTEVTCRNFKKEVKPLCILGFFEMENSSEWGAPSFTKHKPKTSHVCFLSDFRNLN